MAVVLPASIALHILGVVGMSVAAVLQVVRAPLGPFKVLKWVWLPAVMLGIGSGLLLLAISVATDHEVNAAKMAVKIGLAVQAPLVAMKYHTRERAETPVWAVPYIVLSVAVTLAVSVLWR